MNRLGEVQGVIEKKAFALTVAWPMRRLPEWTRRGARGGQDPIGSPGLCSTAPASSQSSTQAAEIKIENTVSFHALAKL